MTARGTGTVGAYIELTKPRIIELLLITTVPAMAVAASGWPGLGDVLIALIGGTLAAGGANVINQVYDADIDQVMNRTRGRPLPTDRVSGTGALAFGVILGALGFVVLSVGTTLLAGILSAIAYLGYVFIYTMVLKRSSTQNIVLGGAAGAVPALIGWAAVTGDLSMAAWIMFAIIFFWTPPHFWSLSLKYEDDYRAAGIPMLPVIAGEAATFDLIVGYSVVTTAVSLLLIPSAAMGWIYATVAVVGGIALVAFAVRLRSDRSKAMRYFGFTNAYLASVFLAMLIDRVVLESSVGFDRLWEVVGGVAAVAGIAFVASVERRPGMIAKTSSRMRHFVEVSITVLSTVVLVGFAVFS